MTETPPDRPRDGRSRTTVEGQTTDAPYLITLRISGKFLHFPKITYIIFLLELLTCVEYFVVEILKPVTDFACVIKVDTHSLRRLIDFISERLFRTS